mmetsp:Transcript_4530/g.19283  ORF Transcript_4530/g.19283 Transcript_4530/m.19283 type:complete len:231 (-) Transcript_4530:577-1269(-)
MLDAKLSPVKLSAGTEASSSNAASSSARAFSSAALALASATSASSSGGAATPSAEPSGRAPAPPPDDSDENWLRCPAPAAAAIVASARVTMAEGAGVLGLASSDLNPPGAEPSALDTAAEGVGLACASAGARCAEPGRNPVISASRWRPKPAPPPPGSAPAAGTGFVSRLEGASAPPAAVEELSEARPSPCPRSADVCRMPADRRSRSVAAGPASAAELPADRPRASTSP